jgi:ATP-dependent DNA helicase RecG
VDAVLDLLDYETFFSLLKQKVPESRALILQRLADERLIARDVGDRWNILNVGAMLLARRLDQFEDLARKALRVVQYNGDSRLKIQRSQEGSKGYAAGFRGLLKFIDGLLPSEEQIEGGIRVQRRTYPEITVRELLANALVHQDMTVTGTGPIVEVFDSRIEISNPGVPVTDMLKKLFGAPPRSRNEHMARLMRRMGICEELGSGLVKVVAAVEEHRLPAPDFLVVDQNLRVTLFGPRSFGAMDRTERARVCYQHACLMSHQHRRLTNGSLRDRFGIAERNAAQVSRVIREALDVGLIKPADAERPKAGYLPFWA